MGSHRVKSAREFVLPLCAAFEHSKALLDAKFKRLVVAGLEMQPRMKFGGTPIAAVEHALAKHIQCGSNRLIFAVGHHKQ